MRQYISLPEIEDVSVSESVIKAFKLKSEMDSLRDKLVALSKEQGQYLQSIKDYLVSHSYSGLVDGMATAYLQEFTRRPSLTQVIKAMKKELPPNIYNRILTKYSNIVKYGKKQTSLILKMGDM